MPPSTLEALAANPVFEHVPQEQLQWLVDHSELRHLAPGEFLFQAEQPADHLYVILAGTISIYGFQNKQRRDYEDIGKDAVTGVLPYSRMVIARGFGEVKEAADIVALHRDRFTEMIHDHHELTAAFVHVMTNRVRDFTSLQLQNEKLMSLGKLSAGLAHELNNPASAIVRSSQALKEHLQVIPENFKAVIKVKLTDEMVDKVNGHLFAKLAGYEPDKLSLMERTEKEDEIADWLEENGVEDGFELAELLVEFSFGEEDLEMVMEAVGAAFFPPVIKWIHDNLTTEKMVLEIADASKRISELVSSVKGYTHMDRSTDKQVFDLRQGIRSTLTMLKHKLKQNQIVVVEDFQEELDKVEGFPGEINQVFTNLIDNAVDAMEENGGTLTLRSVSDGKFVRMYVQDNGTGISEEDQRSIFDPFFTTKDMGKGTGMGLDIARKIIKRHGGEIKVESEPGKTVFEVCLPAFTH